MAGSCWEGGGARHGSDGGRRKGVRKQLRMADGEQAGHVEMATAAGFWFWAAVTSCAAATALLLYHLD
jgi:hypothetical protein